MTGMMQFSMLVIATLFAAAAAVAFHWMLLRTMFVLMKPATAKQRAASAPAIRSAAPVALANGTARLARAYGAYR